MNRNSPNLYENLPDTPGVYLMRDKSGTLLYVGKAGNLRRRVSSYFLRPHDTRIELLVSRIAKIDHEKTDTAIEALIREAELIRAHEPPFNVKERDDKSFLYVQITKGPFPRVLLARGRDLGKEPYKIAKLYGPFTSASNLRAALKVIRRIFPYSTHPPVILSVAQRSRRTSKLQNIQRPLEQAWSDKFRPCFDCELGLCPGTCVGAITKEEYRKTIKNIELFFAGKKERIIKNLTKEMNAAAKKLDFEKAERMRRQIFALKHIQDIASIAEDRIADPLKADSLQLKAIRIEGYDTSNISGVSAVGSMVVFVDGKPDKNEYRKFRIRTVEGANDVGMMREVLKRRFTRSIRHPERSEAKSKDLAMFEQSGVPRQARNDNSWPLPDIVLVDGGIGQVNAARQVLKENKLDIPVVGLAKGPERKRNDVVGLIPKRLKNVDLRTLIKVRDEAHRFAISYHKKLRGRRFFE